MKLQWKLILIGVFIIFPLSLVIVTHQKWDTVKINFFSYTLSDVINLVCTGYIGIVVMIIFSTMSSNSMKRLEIISENLTMLQDYADTILKTFSSNINRSININTKSYLLRILRTTSNEVSNIQAFLMKEKKDREIKDLLESIEKDFLGFKEIITDKPFQQSYRVKEIDIQAATDSQNKIRQNTQKIKMNLYK